MKRTTKPLSAQISETSKAPIEERQPTQLNPANLIPTGSTLLNCACADNPWAGFGLGKLVNIIGDSSSGKTLLVLTCLAETALLKRFRKYRLIFDDVEQANEFDLKYLFDEPFVKRLEQNITSKTMDDFQDNVLNAISEDKPFVYVLDSLDALHTKAEVEKAFRRALAKAKNETHAKEIKKAFEADKARDMTNMLRMIVSPVKETKSLLIIISQTRDNIGVTFGSKKRRAGGKALKFYATHEMWLAVRKSERKKDQEIGIHAIANVSKNKLTGKRRKIPHLSMFYDYGIDDIGANINFLLEQNHWGGGGTKNIEAEEFNVEMKHRRLVRHIEKEGLEDRLREIVGQVWVDREENLRTKRKPRF
jgi:RecA/RadA recombinase